MYIIPKYVDCPYDIILDLDILREIGLKIDCQEDMIEWNKSVTLFKPLRLLYLETNDTILHEYNTLALIKEAKDPYNKKISDNKYSSKDWKNAVAKSCHLSPAKCKKCWYLLENMKMYYKENMVLSLESLIKII